MPKQSKDDIASFIKKKNNNIICHIKHVKTTMKPLFHQCYRNVTILFSCSNMIRLCTTYVQDSYSHFNEYSFGLIYPFYETVL